LKVPRFFDNFEETVFMEKEYQTLAFDVSSNWAAPPRPDVPFTVTANMMNQAGFHTADGYAYILFAPLNQVKAMLPPSPTVAPVVSLPKVGIKAYVLNAPDFLFVFRYRGPAKSWAGSPTSAPCGASLTKSLNMPAKCQDFGGYLPEITRVSSSSVSQLASMVQ